MFVEHWQGLMRVVVVVKVERDHHIHHTCKCDYMLVTCMAMSEQEGGLCCLNSDPKLSILPVSVRDFRH